MRSQVTFDRIVSVVLAVSGLSIAGALVHREFFSGQPASRPARDIVSSRFEASWESLLPVGTRLMGPDVAQTHIIEFGDFECPYCRRLHTELSKALSANDSVQVTFVHFPLRIHRFARPAARAAECAAAQGRFGPFADALFAKQDSLGLKTWASYSRDAGIRDTIAFAQCVSKTTPVAAIEAGVAAADRLGLHATPTVLIDGWFLSRIPPGDSLRAIIADIRTRKARRPAN